MRFILVFVAALLLSATAKLAVAATLDIGSGNRLLGASEVIVDDILYTFEFVEGSCQSLYGDCVDSSLFTFQSEASALRAAAALFEQVIIDTSLEPFREKPGQTNGCTSIVCDVIIPYQVDTATNRVLAVVARNNPLVFQSFRPDFEVFLDDFAISNDTISEPGSVYLGAVATGPVAHVPLPSSGWALLTALLCARRFARQG